MASDFILFLGSEDWTSMKIRAALLFFFSLRLYTSLYPIMWGSHPNVYLVPISTTRLIPLILLCFSFLFGEIFTVLITHSGTVQQVQ